MYLYQIVGFYDDYLQNKSISASEINCILPIMMSNFTKEILMGNKNKSPA